MYKGNEEKEKMKDLESKTYYQPLFNVKLKMNRAIEVDKPILNFKNVLCDVSETVIRLTLQNGALINLPIHNIDYWEQELVKNDSRNN